MTQERMAFLQPLALKQMLYEKISTQYLTIIFCFTSLVFVLKLIRRNKLNLPPSPPKLPIIGNLHQLGTLPHQSFHALSKKYGPLMMMKLGQTPAIVVSSVEVAKEIFKNHDVVFSNKPPNTAANIILYGCTDIALAPYGEEWRQRRKICVVELLSMKRVQSFQSIREEEVAEIVDTLKEACASASASASKESSIVNLSEMLIAASNNIVSRCVLGQKYDTPDGSGSFGELGRKMMKQLAAFSVGDLFPSLGWIDILTGQISEFKATFCALDSFFDQVIADHKRMKKSEDGQSDKKDFVEILLQVQDGAKYDFPLTNDNIKAILMVCFFLYYFFSLFLSRYHITRKDLD